MAKARAAKKAKQPARKKAKQRAAPKKSRAPKRAAPQATQAGTVEGYVHRLPSPQATIVQRLRALVREVAPEALETFKWAQPVYEFNGPVAHIKAHSKYVNFGFWRGSMLLDSSESLEGEDGSMRHLKLSSLDDVRTDVLRTLMRQAMLLNRRLGDPTSNE